ncbi:GAF and ANTAR domain-containing protein [Mumia qirimensis]|uniref:GAF and ANTAR domain-containing protein n=1 Tax=Mumia qirimensis TaxID=3234852 RepID=UPI00351D37A5
MARELDAREFADIAEALHTRPTPTDTAEQVVAYARDQLDADWAGLTLIRAGGRLITAAPSDPLVETVDRLQYELDEGPCRDSAWHDRTLVARDLRCDPRWPQWGPKAAALGITSALAAELSSSDRRIGSINLYWRERRDISSDDAAYAHIFARHAALALQESFSHANLHVALDTRKLIGQAQGILMERFGLQGDQAFAVLRRYSQTHNLKLRAVAEELVATRHLPGDSGGELPG